MNAEPMLAMIDNPLPFAFAILMNLLIIESGFEKSDFKFVKFIFILNINSRCNTSNIISSSSLSSSLPFYPSSYIYLKNFMAKSETSRHCSMNSGL